MDLSFFFKHPPKIGMLAGIASCFLFLVYHHITISNIWFSAPFMLVVSILAGFMLAKSYDTLFEKYSICSWLGYNSIFIGVLLTLGLASTVLYSPRYTSAEILNTGGPPPDGLISSALPLTISGIVITSIIISLVLDRSFTHLALIVGTTAVIMLSLGLNVSILGYVNILPQHKYLVEKFLLLNVFIGYTYTGSYIILRWLGLSLFVK